MEARLAAPGILLAVAQKRIIAQIEAIGPLPRNVEWLHHGAVSGIDSFREVSRIVVVGRLLRAQDRHPYRPAHLHALISKQGYKVLISQVYDPEDPHIDTDVQFGVTQALLGDFVRHDEPHPVDAVSPWYSLDYVYVMEPGEAVLPRAPIK